MIQTSKHLCYNTSGPCRGRFYFQGASIDIKVKKPWVSFETQLSTQMSAFFITRRGK